MGDPPAASQQLARLLGAFLWPAGFPLLSVAVQIPSFEYGVLGEALGLDLMKAVLDLCFCYRPETSVMWQYVFSTPFSYFFTHTHTPGPTATVGKYSSLTLQCQIW